jgi:hypothetical protein
MRGNGRGDKIVLAKFLGLGLAMRSNGGAAMEELNIRK